MRWADTLDAVVLNISWDGCLVEMQCAMMPGTELTSIVLQLGRAGLSATELARRTGVSRPTLWSWETGKSRSSPDNLLKLKDALAITRGEQSPVPPQSLGLSDRAASA